MEIYLLGGFISAIVSIFMFAITMAHEEDFKTDIFDLLIVTAVSIFLSWLWILFLIMYFTLEYIKGKK